MRQSSTDVEEFLTDIETGAAVWVMLDRILSSIHIYKPLACAQFDKGGKVKLTPWLDGYYDSAS